MLNNRIKIILLCLLINSSVFAQNHENKPFLFGFKNIGKILDSLALLDHRDNSLNTWEQCIITNQSNEVLICNFVLGGSKFQIEGFKLFNKKSIFEHGDSLFFNNESFSDTVFSAILKINDVSFIFDRDQSLNSGYLNIIKKYGKPDVVKKNGLYNVLIYRFNNRRYYRDLLSNEIYYYKFLFYKNKLIEVVISSDDY